MYFAEKKLIKKSTTIPRFVSLVFFSDFWFNLHTLYEETCIGIFKYFSLSIRPRGSKPPRSEHMRCPQSLHELALQSLTEATDPLSDRGSIVRTFRSRFGPICLRPLSKTIQPADRHSPSATRRQTAWAAPSRHRCPSPSPDRPLNGRGGESQLP